MKGLWLMLEAERNHGAMGLFRTREIYTGLSIAGLYIRTMQAANERMSNMYTIEIRIECPSGCCEVLPNDVNTAELLVENIISQAMLELFETVIVKQVIVKFNQLEVKHDEVLS